MATKRPSTISRLKIFVHLSDTDFPRARALEGILDDEKFARLFVLFLGVCELNQHTLETCNFKLSEKTLS